MTGSDHGNVLSKQGFRALNVGFRTFNKAFRPLNGAFTHPG